MTEHFVEPPDDASSISDASEEADEGGFVKFDSAVMSATLIAHHPESKQLNYKEILALAKITRDKDGDIIDVLHQTIPFMTKYERARLLGLRATQLSQGAEPLVTVPRDMISSYAIASLELEQARLPFIIRRPLPSGASEYWKVKDLMLVDF